MKIQAKAATYGAISGLISTVLVATIGGYALKFAPGIIFGVFFVVYVMNYCRTMIANSLVWVFAVLFTLLSGAGYYLAFFLCSQFYKEASIFSTLLAGFSGTLVLVVALVLSSLGKLSVKNGVLTIALGCVLGLLLNLSTLIENTWSIGILFIPWQSLVFASLVNCIIRPDRAINAPSSTTKAAVNTEPLEVDVAK